MPLVIIGSVFLIIGNFPVDSWAIFLKSQGISLWLNKLIDGSFGIIGLVASFSIAYSLTTSWQEDGVASGIISLSSYLILSPYSVAHTESMIQAAYSMLYMRSKGTFAAIVISITTARIFHFFMRKNIVIKMPEEVPHAVSRSFTSLIPGFVTILISAIAQYALLRRSAGNIHTLLAIILYTPLNFLGGTLAGTVIAIIVNSLFWLIGIHPSGTINAFMNPIWLINIDQNRLASGAGLDPPNIITQPFMDNFVWMDGAGATIDLMICMLFFPEAGKIKHWVPLRYYRVYLISMNQ